jgi:hypothetical protein
VTQSQIACQDRRPDWEARYQGVLDTWSQAYTDGSGSTKLIYGWRDCAVWCADMVMAVWGVDPMQGLRGTYKSPQGALACFNATSLSDLIGRHMRAIPAQHAHKGDIIVYRNSLNPKSQRQGLGVKDHLYILAPSRLGMVHLIPPQQVAAFTLDREV